MKKHTVVVVGSIVLGALLASSAFAAKPRKQTVLDPFAGPSPYVTASADDTMGPAPFIVLEPVRPPFRPPIRSPFVP